MTINIAAAVKVIFPYKNARMHVLELHFQYQQGKYVKRELLAGYWCSAGYKKFLYIIGCNLIGLALIIAD